MLAVKELMESDSFKNYLQRRTDLTEELFADKTITNGGWIDDRVNNALGEFNLDQFR
ncbi:hypothetical protein HYW75_05125 [Candidatus Pacearchaeota archaeon]|nr:hypothetical protein [Candidatus Pacearchaeota archaeon]